MFTCPCSKTEKVKTKSKESFEQKLARSDPEFLEFLKGEKSDLLAFDDGDLSEDSNEDDVEEEDTDTGNEHGASKKKKKKPEVKCHVSYI